MEAESVSGFVALPGPVVWGVSHTVRRVVRTAQWARQAVRWGIRGEGGPASPDRHDVSPLWSAHRRPVRRRRLRTGDVSAYARATGSRSEEARDEALRLEWTTRASACGWGIAARLRTGRGRTALQRAGAQCDPEADQRPDDECCRPQREQPGFFPGSRAPMNGALMRHRSVLPTTHGRHPRPRASHQSLSARFAGRIGDFPGG